MNESINTIWAEVLEILQSEMPELSFNVWVSPLMPLDLIGDTLYIKVETPFNRSIIENRHLPLMNAALMTVLNRNVTIELLNDEKELPNNPTTMIEEEIPLINSLPPKVNKITPENQTNLNPKYTFDKFVIGENNRFAHAACVAVSESPAERYNPLFIYGGVGLGKTHLMQAVGNYIKDSYQNKKVLYITCESFMNEFIDSITYKTNVAFRNKYRNVDILLIDDIQFLAKKEATQVEFFHTFNDLHDQNKQIIISSDRPPREIQNLTERLRSRFEQGLITDISAPNFETRIAILKKKAESNPETIPNEVLSYIADNIHSNIRELEGALTTIIAYAKLHNHPISLQYAKLALKDHLSEKDNVVIDAPYIKEVTAKYFNVTIEELDSKKRTKAISMPRQVAMYLTRELTELSLPKIGEEFGGRDHSTVIHGVQKVTDEMQVNTDFKNLIIRIQNEIVGNH